MTDPEPAITWRVMTWNVRGAGHPDLAAIASIVTEQQPDVIALQEVRRGQAASLARLLGWRHHWTRKHYPYSPVAWWLAEGAAIMSPHALIDVARRTLTPGASTWTYRHRVVLAATARRNDDSLRLYDVHLAAHHRPDERIAQAERVVAMIQADRPTIAVVAGDLNASDEVEVIRPFHAVGLHDPGGGPTHPSMSPVRRFDYVLVPDTAVVTDRFEPDGGDDWRELSDHLPTVVEFRVGDSAGSNASA